MQKVYDNNMQQICDYLKTVDTLFKVMISWAQAAVLNMRPVTFSKNRKIQKFWLKDQLLFKLDSSVCSENLNSFEFETPVFKDCNN